MRTLGMLAGPCLAVILLSIWAAARPEPEPGNGAVAAPRGTVARARAAAGPEPVPQATMRTAVEPDAEPSRAGPAPLAHERPTPLRVVVVDERFEPVAGALVELRHFNCERPRVVPTRATVDRVHPLASTACTDARGMAVLACDAEVLMLRAESAGHGESFLAPVWPGAQGVCDRLHAIYLHRPVRVRGRVTREGAAVAGCAVHAGGRIPVLCGNDVDWWIVPEPVCTGPDGAFELELLDHGTWSLWASDGDAASGVATVPLRGQPAQSVTLGFVSGPRAPWAVPTPDESVPAVAPEDAEQARHPGELEVRVERAAGKPARYVTILVRSTLVFRCAVESHLADDAGRARIEGLVPGPYRVSARDDQRTLASATAVVRGAQSTTLVLRIDE